MGYKLKRPQGRNNKYQNDPYKDSKFLVAPILVVPPIFKIITVLQTIIKQDIELCLI